MIFILIGYFTDNVKIMILSAGVRLQRARNRVAASEHSDPSVASKIFTLFHLPNLWFILSQALSADNSQILCFRNRSAMRRLNHRRNRSVSVLHFRIANQTGNTNNRNGSVDVLFDWKNSFSVTRKRCYPMRCPRCGADIADKEACGKCGLKPADYRKDIEVQYKDFKTSELLEIRQKKHSAPPFDVTEAAPKQTAIFHKTERKSLPFLAIVLLILALLSGAFFIVRYLVHP
jgi:ribosomal protein S27AE